VADGQAHGFDALCKDAGRSGIGFEGDPVIPEHAAIVVGQGSLLFQILAIECGSQSETGQSLEAVADPDDQFSGGNKFFQFFCQTELDPVGKNRAGTQMVAKGKTADEIAALVAEGYGVESVQTAGCTIAISDLVAAAVKAVK
jgi:hypothetical protein